MSNKAKGCAIITPLGFFYNEAVNETVASAMKVTAAERTGQGKKKTVLKRIHHRKVVYDDKVVGCRVLRKPKLTALEMLQGKAVKDEAARSGEEQRAVIALLQTKPNYYDRQGIRANNRNSAGSSGSSNEGNGSRVSE